MALEMFKDFNIDKYNAEVEAAETAEAATVATQEKAYGFLRAKKEWQITCKRRKAQGLPCPPGPKESDF